MEGVLCARPDEGRWSRGVQCLAYQRRVGNETAPTERATGLNEAVRCDERLGRPQVVITSKRLCDEVRTGWRATRASNRTR